MEYVTINEPAVETLLERAEQLSHSGWTLRSVPVHAGDEWTAVMVREAGDGWNPGVRIAFWLSVAILLPLFAWLSWTGN